MARSAARKADLAAAIPAHFYSAANIAGFVIAKENPRTIRRDEDVAALAANIGAHGVIEPVVCYLEGGKLRVTVGGTRLLAARRAGLTELPYTGLPKDAAIAAGLAEEEGHTPLHPADQARAYAAELARLTLAQEGGEGPVTRDAAVRTIANRVGKTPRFVEQRLALAALHPPILKALHDNRIGLDQASAWANAPVERQADVWTDCGARAIRLDTRGIRDVLAKADLDADDRLVRFAGAERYAAAGGMIRQDLFPIDATGEINLDAKPAQHFDREAVKTAAKARLQEEAEKYRKQGWGFVLTKAGSVMGAPSGYTIGKPCTTKEQKAKAGVSLSIGYDGKLAVQLHLRKQAEKKPAASQAANPAVSAAANEQADRIDLTCEYAEQIVGRSLRSRPDVALAALLAELARCLFIAKPNTGGLLDIYPEEASRDATGLASDAESIAEFNRLEELLTPYVRDLETFITEEMTEADRGSLIACTVLSVLRLHWSPNAPHSNHRRDQLATLGRLAGVDLSNHLTEAVADKVDMPILRQLVGVDPIGKPAAKPAAKAKTSRGAK